MKLEFHALQLNLQERKRKIPVRKFEVSKRSSEAERNVGDCVGDVDDTTNDFDCKVERQCGFFMGAFRATASSLPSPCVSVFELVSRYVSAHVKKTKTTSRMRFSQ